MSIPPRNSLKVILMTMMMLLLLLLHAVSGAGKGRCIENEREALLHFKASVVDYYGMLSSWNNNTDCCLWKGVSCNNHGGHVHSLHLPGHYNYDYHYLLLRTPLVLSGQIHPSLMELKQLQYFNLSGNIFEDTALPQFFGFLTNLRYLDLSFSRFHGKIPTQFGSLSQLRYLNLAFNNLEGSIPYQLGNLSMLHHLDLSYNNLQGKIPSQLGKLLSLRRLYIGDNSLRIGHGNDSGGQWLSNLTSLTHIDLTHVMNLNSSHTWIQMISNLSNLRELTLYNCSLSDHFILSSLYPSNFKIPSSLYLLDLSYNSFTPSILFNWLSNVTSNLVELDIQGSLLEGSTKKNLGIAMNSLEHLDLSYNSLKSLDLIPFLNICTLHILYMVGNNLIDDLPSIVHNMSVGCARYSLQELYLNDNQITGTLPDLSIFSSLKTLDLSRNRLNGKIPEGTKLPSHLESLSICINSLDGGIPNLFENTCNLISLDMSENNLSEVFSVIIHHLSGCARHTLQKVYLNDNKIIGTMPNLSTFPTLKELDVSNNLLNGKIPEDIRLPTQLSYLSISSNSLEGGIPKSFGKTCNLSSLDLSNNSLSEELSMIIHQLNGCATYSLGSLYLSMNQMNGTLPDLSMFTSLERLSLSKNKLTGKIPKDIRFPSRLRGLYMSSNYFEGVFPESHFADMPKLEYLDLSDNFVALVFGPPFQLREIRLRSFQLGPAFPRWLKTQNKYEYIDISNAGMSDTVPQWFWGNMVTQLPYIKRLNISYNNLKGSIANLAQPVNGLLRLYAASNQFEGPIPSFLRGAVSLDLSRNRFSDSHSFVCGNGTAETLSFLDLSHNHLSGKIPNCWSNFKALVYLDLSHNNFSEEIPASLGSLLDLEALLLTNNSLSGEIPSSIKSYTNLIMLDLGENKVSGDIPSWIGSRLQELQFLSLRRNHLLGTLPSQLCYLKSIKLLDLSLNNLSGHIPKCIKNFISMTQKSPSTESFHTVIEKAGIIYNIQNYYLNVLLMWKGVEQMFGNGELPLLNSIDLSSNQLSGEIPAHVENLLGLVSLNLSRNNFTGKIPSKIGMLTSLEFLDLSRNQLFGSIPSSLSQIDRLAILDVSHNHLSGRIPTGRQLQTFDASRYEDNLDLCGEPLEKLCVQAEPPQSPTKLESDEDEHMAFAHAFYMSMGFGFAVGFWGIFGSILMKRSWRHAYFRFLNNLTDNIYVMIAVKFGKYSKWLKG